MKPPGDCRQSQEAVRVKEEPPELSPPPHGACASSVPIKEEPQQYVKEKALSVEGELQSSSSEADLHGVSAAAMLACLYTDHVVKGELLLGPELPHRPTVNPVFYEPPPQTKPVQLVYDSHGVCLGDNTYMSAESPTKVHIKEEPQKYVKEEALSVEGELQSSSSEAGLHGVSAAAMLAGLYTDHVVKGELLLGPELPYRPTVNPVFYAPIMSRSGRLCRFSSLSDSLPLTLVFYRPGMKSPGDCRQGQEAVRVKEEPPELSPPPHGARAPSEPTRQTTPVQLVYDSHGVSRGDNTYMSAESPPKVHIKEEPQKYVKEEALSVEGELQSSSSEAGLHGVSAAAMLAGLYTDHVVKGELLLGPELPHRPTVNPVFYGRAVSSDAGVAEALGRRCSVRPERLLLDAGVAEALGRRCSVRPERLLLDAERRACRVGRRTYRLRPESEPRRAATPATDTYRCDHCDKSFAHKSVLRKHIPTHQSTRLAQSRYSTREDSNLDQNKKLDTSLKGNLQRHESSLTREKRFQCDYCDYKCSRKDHLRQHEMRHTAVKPYQCNYCDYKCNQKGTLREHEMRHTGVKPYQCNYCDYKCSRNDRLRSHERTHTGVKPFQCDYCDYKCSRKEDLRRHEMSHTGVKPFQCNYCDYKCSRKEHLRRHEMTHTGVKPFQCNYCGYKFSQKVHLRTHEMRHTGVKPFQCDYCDYKCSRNDQLRSHEMTHTAKKPFKETRVV